MTIKDTTAPVTASGRMAGPAAGPAVTLGDVEKIGTESGARADW